MCLYPKVIKNPKYKANKKNGGVIPPITDERVVYVPIGCQNCMECRKQKARNWQVRLLEDLKEHKNGKFITLTFSDEAYAHYAKEFEVEGYELDNEIATRAVRLFLERWRKKYKKSLRHWLVTELGHNGTENIHLHGLIWTDESLDEVERIWNSGEDEEGNNLPNGYVWKGVESGWKNGKPTYKNYVNARTVNYIIKYVSKMDEKHKTYKSRILTSPGIGRCYTTKGDYKRNLFKLNSTREYYKSSSGHKIGLPIYWRNKIYSETEREKLWLMKLDKQERWVLGTRIDISQGEEIYYKALEEARRKNKQFGYGDDIKNWEMEQYERERRIIKQRTRLERARGKAART